MTSPAISKTLNMQRLLAWQNSLLATKSAKGENFYLGIPDSWYTPLTWACAYGHIENEYVVDDVGRICLRCSNLVLAVPPRTTKSDLLSVIYGRRNTVTEGNAG